MIRKAVIVVLTVASILLLITWALSYVRPLAWAKGDVDVSDIDDMLDAWVYAYGAYEGDLDSELKPQLYVGFSYGEFWFGYASVAGSQREVWWGELEGVAHLFSYVDGTMRTTDGRLRLWIPFLLMFFYPTIAFVRGPYRRHRRRKKDLCITCGYDLTGNVSGVCPECGERI